MIASVSPFDKEAVYIKSYFGSDTVLLWLAIGLGLIFVAALIFDQIRRKRKKRGSWEKSSGFRTGIRNRFRAFYSLRTELKEAARDRARRREREEGRRTGTKR